MARCSTAIVANRKRYCKLSDYSKAFRQQKEPRNHFGFSDQDSCPTVNHTIMDNVYEIDGPIARQYSDLDDAVKREVREYYQTWAQHHLEDPAEFNEAELQELVDDQVFSGWNGDTKIMEPEMEWPRLKDIYVRVGIFSKVRVPVSY